MMSYNPPYYAELLAGAGGRTEMKFSADQTTYNLADERISSVADIVKQRYPLEIQEIDYRNFKSEASVLNDIYNDAFHDHWGYLPLSDREFLFMANDLIKIMDKRLLFSLYLGGTPAAFILAVPNINELLKGNKSGRLRLMDIYRILFRKNSVKWVKVMVVAVRSKYRHMGLGSVLYMEMTKRVKAYGYKGGELSWIAEENTVMEKIIKDMGAKPTKEYVVYAFDVG